MLLKLISRIFTMSQLPKTVKSNKKKTSLLPDKESLEKLSQEELIQIIGTLKEHNHNLINIIKKKEEIPCKNSKSSRKIIDFNMVPKRHVFLKFYYLGWDYQGYVIQENTSNTIEEHVLGALKKCALIESKETCNYHVCGRTDKGVSAFSQIISLDLRSKLSEPTPENVEHEYPYCLMLNRLLPEKIKCYAWAHVMSNTNARFNCSSRKYKYYFPKGNLDIEMMQKGAKFLLGTHDFRNFCKMDVGNGVTKFVRDIKFVDIRPCSPTKKETSGYQMFEFVIQGNAFLYHQIRSIMSVLFLIGQGKESPDVVNRLLDIEENPCRPQYNLASPLPLNLFDVEYEGVDASSWNINEEEHSKVIGLLQNQWTENKIKCAMIKDMIGNLEKYGSGSTGFEKQAESLMIDMKRKTYQPLLSRQKSGSLEEKIEHYVKKGRLEVVHG